MVFSTTGELQSSLGVTESKLRVLEFELMDRYNLFRRELIEIHYKNNIHGVGVLTSMRNRLYPDRLVWDL